MKKISLNQDWQFAKGTITMMELMMGDAGNIENIDLPHDAMIYQERTPATEQTVRMYAERNMQTA